MKIDDNTAQRMYPARRYGSMPQIDQFITQGEKVEGKTQPDPLKRWMVNSIPFPNLTQAREHVRDTLEISCNDELGSPTLYTPATGYKQKGSTMKEKPEVIKAVVTEPAVEQVAAPVAKPKVTKRPKVAKDYHPKYELTFPLNAKGRPVSIKVNDLDSLDDVIQMIKKHNL